MWIKNKASIVFANSKDSKAAHGESPIRQTETPAKVTVLIFAGQSFKEVVTFDTEQEADAFCRGLSKGAEFYDLSCGYMMPRDEKQLIKEESEDQVKAARKRMSEYAVNLRR